MAEQNEQQQPQQQLQQAPPQENKKLIAYEKIALQTKIDAETIAVIHQSVAKNTSVAELAYFLNVAKGLDLNPFNKEVWCYKDLKDNLLVFTGRDGFLKKAQQHPRYNGFRSHEVCENDIFEVEITNTTVNINHKIKPSREGRGPVLGAYFLGFLKDGEPFFEWDDFARYNKGKFTWQTHPEEMIKKVVESHGLKKCFGITGLQAEEDFEIREDGIAYPIEREGKTILNK